MITTQLFVELLIVGIGVAIWLSIFIANIIGFRWGQPIPNIGTAYMTALLGMAYVLGIIVDRGAYSLFNVFERKNRINIFGENPDPTVEEREKYILHSSSSLRDQILYNRSRLRICRSWIINFAFIGMFSGIWIIRQYTWEFCLLFVGGIILSIVTAFTAHSLAKDHYRNIMSSYCFLLKHDKFNAS